VAHRDIKPENILAGPYGEVLLLDWGLAKVWRKDGTIQSIDSSDIHTIPDSDQSMTGHGKLQGTLCYMSPEQIRRDTDISYSTDIYSLGSVLYEVLTGQPPFNSDKTYEILDMVQNQEPEKPSEISKFRVPRILENLCLKCLDKDPARRPASMGDVIKTLHHDWTAELVQRKR
ncbi:serine/threonine protein kinase, partial [Kaarinaea lacus]